MNHLKQILFLIPLLIILISGCTSDINLDLPAGEQKIVVEGHIEPGIPPFIMLTKSTGYFSSTSLEDIANSFVHNAVIKISEVK